MEASLFGFGTQHIQRQHHLAGGGQIDLNESSKILERCAI